MEPERRWRIVVSLTGSTLAGVVGFVCWWRTVPGLWELATFTPTGPIRPMGLVGYLMLGVIVSFFLWPLVTLIALLSQRSVSGAAAALGLIALLLPVVNFVLFWVIILVRGIELSP